MKLERKNLFCKKLIYKSFADDTNPTVLLGIILEENETFLTFKTAKREYRIYQNSIVSIEETDIIFKEVQK